MHSSANSNSDICKGGIGGAVQNNVLGIATGVLIDDELCQLLKLSRPVRFWHESVGGSNLVSGPSCWTSMADARDAVPCSGLIGAEAAAYWQENPHNS